MGYKRWPESHQTSCAGGKRVFRKYLKTHDYIDDRPDVKVSDDEKDAKKK